MLVDQSVHSLIGWSFAVGIRTMMLQHVTSIPRAPGPYPQVRWLDPPPKTPFETEVGARSPRAYLYYVVSPHDLHGCLP